MTILSRQEQEMIILTFEKDYGRLIMNNNKATADILEFKNKVKVLMLEIKKTAKPSVFDEDMLEFLNDMSNSLVT